jgi:YHS domain-containing protein
MLAFIIRILIYISTLFLIGKLLQRFFPMLGRQDPRGGTQSRTAGRTMVKDPMCGMYMDPRLAVKADYKQEKLYFCSEACRQKFLAKAS